MQMDGKKSYSKSVSSPGLDPVCLQCFMFQQYWPTEKCCSELSKGEESVEQKDIEHDTSSLKYSSTVDGIRLVSEINPASLRDQVYLVG